jgi:hypothetical protein
MSYSDKKVAVLELIPKEFKKYFFSAHTRCLQQDET